MSPAFINTNPHEVYFNDPERQDERTSEASGLLRVAAESEFEVASGRIAEEAEKVPGVYKRDSKEAREFTKKGGELDQRNIMRSSSGDNVFPVPEEERTAERSGLHITGRDSGVPVANDLEPGDTKDGSGEDRFKGIAAVEQGKVERGDVPKAVAESEVAVETPGDQPLKKLSVKVLKKLAEERNVEVKGTGNRGSKKKDDYVRALEAAAAEGGGGGVAVQSEEPSRTEKSEAVGEPGGTLTTEDDPTSGTPVGKEPSRPRRRSSGKKSGAKKSSSRSKSSRSKSRKSSSRKGGS